MRGFELYKKYIIKFLLIVILILTGYNVISYLFIKTKTSMDSSLDKFVKYNTDSKVNYYSELNLYFIVTPVDCDCLSYIVTSDFIESIASILKERNKTISINYIVSGDFKPNELENYIFQIKNSINYYIDKNNKAKAFIFKNFKTYRTPLLLILDNNGTIKYWQEFRSDTDKNETLYNFFKLLEAIT